MNSYVYILSNKNRTVLYTGVTANLVTRVYQHKSGEIPGFTKRYNCHELVYFEEFASINEAIAREKILKKYRRDWKFQLITKMNLNWEDLSKHW
jgi:putative endonuclease